MSDPGQEEMAPYVIEGARSARSRCKTCRRTIDKGSLRIGMLIEGPYGTGYLWHHLRCAARRQYERVAEAYEGEAWKEAKEPPSKVPSLDELQSLRDQAEERRQMRKTIPYAELAPSSRSKCKHCGEKIEQGDPRVVLGRGVQFGTQVRTAPVNIHPACVAAELKSPECTTEAGDFEAALRANTTELPESRLEAVLGQIGDLG